MQRAAGCETPAQGGEAAWTPCWISVEAGPKDRAALVQTLRDLKGHVVAAARLGKLELFAIPASAQIGDSFRRYRDVLDIVDDLG